MSTYKEVLKWMLLAAWGWVFVLFLGVTMKGLYNAFMYGWSWL